ncbi:MAG: GAF domain-containing protein, partial [Chloroflexota bacterium]
RVADQVVGTIAELLDVKVALVEQITNETIRAIAMYEEGRVIHEGEFPLRGTPCERVKFEKQICIYNQVAERFPEDPFLREKGLNAYVGLPILDSRGRVIGVINAMDDRPREFTAEDLELLQTMAQWVGLELERAKVEAQVQRRSKELAALHAVAATVSRSLDLERVLNDALDEILKLEIFKAEARANIFLLDEATGTLSLAAAHGMPAGHPCRQNPVKVGECLCGLAVQEGKVNVSDDAWPDLCHARRWPDMPPHEDVCVPLKAKGQVLGVLDVWLPATWKVTENETALLTAIGDQIGVAIENARLYEETKRRAGELSAIAEVGGLVTAGEELPATLDTLAEKIARATGFEAVDIGLYDAERQVLTFPSLYSTVTVGLLEGRKGTTVRLEDAPVLQHLLREKRHLLLDDPQNDPRVRESQRELARRDGVQAVLAMPLLFRQELVGILDLISTSRRVFSPEDVSLLTTLADQVAVTIYNARLYQQAQQRLTRLTAIEEIHRAITSTLNLDEMLTVLLENVIKVSHVDTATVMLIRPESDELESITSLGVKEKQVATLRLKVGEGAAGWVAREGLPLAIADVQGDPRFLYKDLAAKAEIVSYLGVPLKVKGEVIGVLNVSTKHRHEFTAEELDFFATLGGEAAMAIENSRLYGQIEERAQELSRDLLEQKQYAENVLRSISDGVYTVDRNRVVLSWSDGAEAITGYTAEETIGRPCADFLRHVDESGEALCETTRCPFLRVWATGQPVAPEQAFAHHRDGREVPVAFAAAPILDETGQPIGAVEVFRDVSKERELMERIQAASRAKSEFLANMSHELRTPLNSIIGFSEVLQDQAFGPLNEKQARYVGNVLQSGRHLLQLINDVLDISKVEAGKMELVKSEFLVAQALEGSLAIFRVAASKKNLALELNVSPEVTTIVADEVRFKQIMYNLLSNAVKFTPEGGRIVVRSETVETKKLPSVWGGLPTRPTLPDHCLLTTVSDTGIGIAEEDMARIWQEFERVESTYTRRYGGTGLGLPLTKRLVELHGGRIWAESEGPGKGSTFTFVLPL